jgi:pyrimidine operon attenuation protein/uracil phosphoribosyltransferase
MYTLDAEAAYSLLFTQLRDTYGDALGAPDGVALVGIRSGGAWVAERIAADLAELAVLAKGNSAAGLSDDAVGGEPATLASVAELSDVASAAELAEVASTAALGVVNVSLHRDDFASKGLHGHPGPTQLPFEITARRILLIDDVLYTGRTIRAALNELYDYGRPASVDLAVLLDRGGRELPVAARFVGARVDVAVERAVVLSRDEAGRFSFDTASRVD